MADTYGVTPDDVSSELRNVFANGFAATTVPSLAQVVSLIRTADLRITLRVINATGGTPELLDRAAPLAQRYILDWVKAQVLRQVYSGNDLQSLEQAVSPYVASADALALDIEKMGLQATGAGDASPRTAVAYSVPDRALLITDDTLGQGDTFGRRRAF